MSKSGISLSQVLIVKNEEENIWRALSWAKPVASEQIVVDTGSTDRTAEIAERMGARVYHFDWCDDFSAARNFALDQAKSVWIAFLDADEYLSEEDVKKLPSLLQTMELAAKDVLYSAFVNLESDGKVISTTTKARIFRNDPMLRYQGRVHEALVNRHGEPLRVLDASGEIMILHTGYSTAAAKKKELSRRNVHLINQELKENPENSEMYGYLGDEYLNNQDFESAEQAYTRSIHFMEEKRRALEDEKTAKRFAAGGAGTKTPEADNAEGSESGSAGSSESDRSTASVIAGKNTAGTRYAFGNEEGQETNSGIEEGASSGETGPVSGRGGTGSGAVSAGAGSARRAEDDYENPELRQRAADTYVNLLYILSRDEKHSAATYELYEKGTELFPEEPDLPYMMGNQAFAHENYKEASEYLANALAKLGEEGSMAHGKRLKTNLQDAYEELGYSLLQTGAYDDARTIAQAVLNSDQESYKALLTLLTAYKRKGIPAEQTLVDVANFFNLKSLRDRMMVYRGAVETDYPGLVEKVKTYFTPDELREYSEILGAG